MIQVHPTKITLEWQDLLNGLSELPVQEIEQLVEQLNEVIAQRRAASAKEEEAAQLVKKIKEEAPSTDFQQRYNQLLTKSVKNTISPEESEALSEMVAISEEWTAKRLAYFIQLSKIWQISTHEVMDRLDITIPPPIHA
jgi:hypothetical protein